MPTVFVPEPDAVQTLERLAVPELRSTAEALAASIPSFVPEVHGVMRRSYRPAIDEQETSVRVHVGSPFWHWMEYGTRFNPAYRPVQSAASALGLRYEAQ
jgi:hypothetical protein